VDVNNPTGELLPGAYAQVHLNVVAGAPAAILPVSAMLFRSEGLQVAIVDSSNRVELRSVIAGRDFGNELEIVSGIKPTDWVIDNPSDSLISGESVRLADAAPNTGNGATSQPLQ
jgi:membrane fusion protein, multidrug efflux system